MAFDPVQEDCLRLILAAMEREGADPASDAAFIERASEAYRLDPATLIHTDRDRSFHLVAMATELADYRAPFAPSEAEAEQLFSQAEDYLREAVELIAKCSDGLSSSDQCQLVELAGSVALRGGRPLALVKSLAADRDASEGQPNGIGFYGLVRNVRDAALASIDAGGDFVAVGKDVSRAILGASMPSARAAWSIASDIATRTAASAAEKGLRCPARHMLASGAEGAARAAAPSRGAGR